MTIYRKRWHVQHLVTLIRHPLLQALTLYWSFLFISFYGLWESKYPCDYKWGSSGKDSDPSPTPLRSCLISTFPFLPRGKASLTVVTVCLVFTVTFQLKLACVSRTCHLISFKLVVPLSIVCFSLQFTVENPDVCPAECTQFGFAGCTPLLQLKKSPACPPSWTGVAHRRVA